MAVPENVREAQEIRQELAMIRQALIDIGDSMDDMSNEFESHHFLLDNIVHIFLARLDRVSGSVSFDTSARMDLVGGGGLPESLLPPPPFDEMSFSTRGAEERLPAVGEMFVRSGPLTRNRLIVPAVMRDAPIR